MRHQPAYIRATIWILAGLLLLPVSGSASDIAESGFSPAYQPKPEDNRKRILVLHAYYKGFNWADRVTSGIDAVFTDDVKEQLDLDIDYQFMDAKRFKSDRYYQILHDLLQFKSTKVHYDVIIACDDLALNFLLEHREDVYGRVPVVFCGINHTVGDRLEGQELYTGVIEVLDPYSTMEIALKLHPDTKEIVIINDATVTGDQNGLAVMEAISRLSSDNIRFSWLEGMCMTGYENALSALGPGSIILALPFNQDSSGHDFTLEESFDLFYSFAKVPIYAMWDFDMGRGAVGGMIISGFAHGQHAAQMALRVLEGENPGSIPVMKQGANKYMFDYQQLRRWGISSADLPKGSIIINKPFSFYEHYKTRVWTVTIFIASLSVAVVLLLVDIRKRRKAEAELKLARDSLEVKVEDRTRELKTAKEAAETASRAKSAFLANMSHELRTPMTSILGYAQLMQRDQYLQANHRRYVDIINRSGEHLLTLINSVLEISKIEAGQVMLNSVSFDLQALFYSLRPMFEPKLAAKHLELRMFEIEGLPRRAKGDRDKLRQVLMNLLDNATKFTEEGSITITASVREESPEDLRLVVRVDDTGEGIAKDELDNVFEHFEQTASGRANMSGTGLGLAICREYVRLMGGYITVESEVDRGTSFLFEVDLKKDAAPPRLEQTERRRVIGLAPGQLSPRVLVAENDVDSRMILVNLLVDAGFDVRQARDGREALDIFEQWRPNFIWMDIRMPQVDGLEATRHIKSSPAGQSSTVAAVTAHALEEERQAILEVGCDDFVRKPFSVDEIFEVMARHLKLEYAYEDESGRSESQDILSTLDSARLAGLPGELLDKLYRTVLKLDTTETAVILNEIAHLDSATGTALKTLADNLDYGSLLRLLEEHTKSTEEETRHQRM